jgi:hypothetical protein
MMTTFQARLIGMGLDLEIKTMAQGRKMQMTREPAMKSLGRLMDFDAYATFGKGINGRKNAFEWLNETLVEMGEEPIKQLSRD